jgi:hypothetical protein
MRYLLSLLAIVSACSGGTATTSRLGIAKVSVTESSDRLQLDALDANGAPIGRLVLTRGTFRMEDDGRLVTGRRMTLDVLGKQAVHESEGYRGLQLPAFTQPDQQVFNDLLGHPEVRVPLERWGVMVEKPRIASVVPPAAVEQPARGCAYATTASCNASSCAEHDVQRPSWDGKSPCDTAQEQMVCCNNAAHSTAIRKCDFGTENPCGNEGPNGCAVCWQSSWSTWCSATTNGAYWEQAQGCTFGFWSDDVSLQMD